MGNKTYGNIPKKRALMVFLALFDYVRTDINNPCFKRKGDNYFFFDTDKRNLQIICGANTHQEEKEYDKEIRTPISRLLPALGVLIDKRPTAKSDKGSNAWKFDITFWSEDRAENIRLFNEEWEKKKNDGAFPSNNSTKRTLKATPVQKQIDPPSIPTPTTPVTPQIDWLDRSHQLLTAQKHLTTNGLLNDSTRNFDHIHVPLGLIERKERPKVKEEPSPEQGSQLYQTESTETKRFEHEAFLDEVVRNRVAGKHIAIIGEPGAGKTTILTKIGEYLIQQAQQQPESPLVVAWVSLASLDKQELSEYLYTTWLKSAHPARRLLPNWEEELVQLVEQRRVWLLLDGLDEVSHANAPIWLKEQLSGWGQNLRVVVTCRINQWEATAGGNSLSDSFDVYRTLDYSYQTSQGEDQVKQFISNWFGDKEKEVANQIRRELDAPGKERIKDLVKNPLRLTLLCASWEQDNQALPETQADLYQGFVNYLYGWKAREFKEEVKLKDELNLALGELAKAGLNRASINDGAVRRFRFTASEIRKLWQDLPDTLLPAAKNLGWLNVVGEEAKEDLYAFYHPTFQEYFAACSIDDWDYFLPRAHIDQTVLCEGKDVPTYRVFEQKWRQVILLWMGRRNEDVADEIKEELIDKLTEFQVQEGDFDYYRAYCMAAICVGEFKSSQRAKEIVYQIVKWAFGYSNTENKKWITYTKSISSLAREVIPFTHREYEVTILVEILQRRDFDIFPRYFMAKSLGEIAPGNSLVIDAFIKLLNDKNLNNWLRSGVVKALGEIAPRDPLAITALTELVHPPNQKYKNVDNLLRNTAIEALAKIDL